MKDPELTPSAEKIDKIIKRIDSGDIRIPAFQRSYVWKQNQILELLDSIRTNYPIGSILLWYTQDRLKHTRNIAGYLIPDSKIEYPVNYVLDGQQRISSIYAVFSSKAEQDKNTEQYNPNLNIFEIYYDFEIESFKHMSEVDINKDSVIYLKNLIDTTKLIPALQNLNEKYHSQASELCSKFLNYEIPVVTIKYRSKEEVGIIFERINNTGTKLSTIDLMTAWTWTDDFHILEEANKLRKDLEEKGFGKVPYNIVIQGISAVIQNDTTTQSVLGLTGESVRDNWAMFVSSIKKAIDFLSTDIKCINSDFLPFIQQLVAITKFYSISGAITSQQIKALKQWFWKTSFSDRYSTGMTTNKMNLDVEAIVKIRSNDFSVLNLYSHNMTKQEFLNTQFSKANSLTRALILLMAQFNPKDLVLSTAIDLGQSLSEFNRKQYHHVFPKAFLEKQGVQYNKINCLLNFCFLPADSNKKISDKEPSDYMFNLVSQHDFKEILESNLIPIDRTIYLKNDYNEFLDKRSDRIMYIITEMTN
jgi:hypothetical protein